MDSIICVIFMLDDESRAILRQYQANPALNVPELAELVRMTPARVARRLDRLIEDGVITGQEIVIDWAALGYSVHVALRITLDKTVPRAFDDFIAAARKMREVLEIQTFLGRVDVRLLLIARDLPDYHRVYRDDVLTLPHIADIEALMTVTNVKRDEALPL